MNEGLDRFVKAIERACAEGNEYVVILKLKGSEEAMEKLLSKGKVLKKLPSMILLRYGDAEISVSIGGKLLVKNVKSEEEVKELLSKILF